MSSVEEEKHRSIGIAEANNDASKLDRRAGMEGNVGQAAEKEETNVQNGLVFGSRSVSLLLMTEEKPMDYTGEIEIEPFFEGLE